MATLPGKHIPQSKKKKTLNNSPKEQAAWSLEENPWVLLNWILPGNADRKQNETEIKKIPIQNLFYIVRSKDFKGPQYLATHKDFVGTRIMCSTQF